MERGAAAEGGAEAALGAAGRGWARARDGEGSVTFTSLSKKARWKPKIAAPSVHHAGSSANGSRRRAVDVGRCHSHNAVATPLSSLGGPGPGGVAGFTHHNPCGQHHAVVERSQTTRHTSLLPRSAVQRALRRYVRRALQAPLALTADDASRYCPYPCPAPHPSGSRKRIREACMRCSGAASASGL